jgi:hypothetical protein
MSQESPAFRRERIQGWRYDPSGKGYPQLYPADRAQPQISVPKTPSSQRSLKVFVRKVRQRGGTWPPQQQER